MRISPADVDQLFAMATLFTSKYTVMGAVSWLVRPLLHVMADLSLYLHRPEDSTSTEQIECHLPEKSINAVLDKLGKPGAEGIGVQVA
jgi:hypothetical protein